MSIYGNDVSRLVLFVLTDVDKTNQIILLILGAIGARSKRVKWNTKLEHEFINNFKVLQEYFKALTVDKVYRQIPCMYTHN